jgi:hypothetical protein
VLLLVASVIALFFIDEPLRLYTEDKMNASLDGIRVDYIQTPAKAGAAKEATRETLKRPISPRAQVCSSGSIGSTSSRAISGSSTRPRPRAIATGGSGCWFWTITVLRRSKAILPGFDAESRCSRRGP